MDQIDVPAAFRSGGVGWGYKPSRNRAAQLLAPWWPISSRLLVAAGLIVIPLLIFFMVEALNPLTTKELTAADVTIMLILAALALREA